MAVISDLIFLSLTLKGEAGTELVGSLVELLGIERATKTQGDTLTEEDVVGKSGNTTVVDLDLSLRKELVSNGVLIAMGSSGRQTLAKETGSMRYLLATSRPTVLLVLEFQVALAPASTWLLTLW